MLRSVLSSNPLVALTATARSPQSASGFRGKFRKTWLAGLRSNQWRRCYYWWFQDTGADDFVPLSKCPACDSPLAGRAPRLVCEACSIMVAN